MFYVLSTNSTKANYSTAERRREKTEVVRSDDACQFQQSENYSAEYDQEQDDFA